MAKDDGATGYRFFDTQTLPVFRAIAAAVVPSEPGSPGADAPDALRLADLKLSERPEADRRLLVTFLKALDGLPRLRYGKPFTRLSPAQQQRFLAWLESTRLVPKLRAGFFGVKTFALMGYYGSEACFTEIGYPGPRLDAPFYQLRAARKDGQA
jgi:hypothetical protein